MTVYLRALINCTKHGGIHRRGRAGPQIQNFVSVRLFSSNRFDVDDWRTQLGCSIALPLLAPDEGSQMSDEKFVATLSIATMDNAFLRYLLTARVEWSIARCRHLFHILSLTPMEKIYPGVNGMSLITELLYKHCTKIAPLLPHAIEVITAVEQVQGESSSFPLYLKWNITGS
jgi:hypothetical protein